MTWTPERITELKHLWSLGETASVIAKLLGNTRNAVLGKVHRLALPHRSTAPIRTPRQTPDTSQNHKRRRKRPQSAQAPKQPAPAAIKTRGRKTEPPPLDPIHVPHPPRIGELSPGQCCWPEGDPRKPDFHFCGRSKPALEPYCPHHRARSLA